MNSEIIGFLAGSLVALSLIPQIAKSLKTKSTGDLSLQWSVINLTGQALWLAYGIAVKSPALTTMSSITFLMALIMFALKIKYDLKQKT